MNQVPDGVRQLTWMYIMTGSLAPVEMLAGFQIHSLRQSSWPGPDREPTMLVLMTPYGAPEN